MTKTHFIALVALCLMAGGCPSYVNVDVTVVDAISRASIQGVKVVRSTLHYYGIKKVALNEETLARTDSLGRIRIESLNLPSRDNTIIFSRVGYEPTDLLVREISGAPYFNIARAGSIESVSEGPIRESKKIEVPM